MAKTIQLLKMNADGRKFSVVFHEYTENPYWIYKHTWELRGCGYGYSERKRIVAKYADMRSCLYYLAQSV